MGVNSYCFVIESAHSLDRERCCQPNRFGSRDLKHIAVVFLRCSVESANSKRSFFTSQPGAPGCWSASAISRGACQAEVLFFNFPGTRIIHERGSSPESGHRLLTVVVEPIGRHLAQKLVLLTERTVVESVGAQFVVSDDDNPAVSPWKRSHSIRKARNEQTVIHALALLAYDPVGKAPGKIENSFRVGNEFAISDGRSAGSAGQRVVVEPMLQPYEA